MKRGRLRSVERWGVWVFTALVLISIPVSVWVEPGIHIHHERSDEFVISKYVLHLIDGRVVLYSQGYMEPTSRQNTPHYTGPDPTPNPGWRMHYLTRDYYGYELYLPNGNWWRPSWNDDWPASARLELPIMYFGVLFGIPLAVRFRRWLMRLGLDSVECGACGYSLAGLDGGACPECGEGAEDMEESKTTPPCHPEQS